MDSFDPSDFSFDPRRNALTVRALKFDDERALEALLDAGLPADALDRDGWPFIVLAAEGSPKCLALLIDRGAALDAAFNGRLTPVALAAQERRLDCLNILLERGASPQAKAPSKQAPLHDVIGGACANLLIQHGADVDAIDPDGWTPLMWAGARGRIDVMDALLDAGADSTLRNPHGDDAALICCATGQAQALECLAARVADLDGWLCSIDRMGMSPLARACQHGSLACAEFLLRRGACPNGAESGAAPVLLVAGEPSSDSWACLKLLIQAGADLSVRDAKGRSCRDILVEKKWLDQIAFVDAFELARALDDCAAPSVKSKAPSRV
jgi:ankyrin repeat protein